MTDLAPRTRAESEIDDVVASSAGYDARRVGAHRIGATWVFTATGLVDDSFARSLSRAVRAVEPQAAVLDLSDAVIVSRRPLSRALRAALRPGRPGTPSAVSVVCPRLSAVALLRKWGLLGAVSLHLTLDEALQEIDPDEVRSP